jgi:hypothetical protein
MTSRRRFLQVGLAGTALLAVGGVGLAWRAGTPRAPSRPLKALSPAGFTVLAAVAEAVCPAPPGWPSTQELGTAEAVDDLMATLHPDTVAEIEQALGLLESALAGALLDGRVTPFSALPLAARTALLESWRTSRLMLKRQVFKALRGLVASAYFAHPSTWAAVGYPGPPDFRAAAAVESP